MRALSLIAILALTGCDATKGRNAGSHLGTGVIGGAIGGPEGSMFGREASKQGGIALPAATAPQI